MSGAEAAADEKLERLLQEYGPALERMIGSLCPPHGAVDRDEVAQEVRLRLWRALRSERVVERPASYLYRVAATAAIDAVRRVKARREEQMGTATSAGAPGRLLGVEDARPGPERLALSAEAAARLARALDGLAEDRRTAVKLHLQGFTTNEIADLLGWTEARARNLVSRGMKDLRSRLEEGDRP